jgi:hypothetical protein
MPINRYLPTEPWLSIDRSERPTTRRPARDAAPSLLRMLPTCLSAVCFVITSASAICRLVRPRATRAATSRSRSVKAHCTTLMGAATRSGGSNRCAYSSAIGLDNARPRDQAAATVSEPSRTFNVSTARSYSGRSAGSRAAPASSRCASAAPKSSAARSQLPTACATCARLFNVALVPHASSSW